MGSAAVYPSERRDPRCFNLPLNRLRSSKMHISDDFQTLCERVQTMVRQRRRKEKRHMEIVCLYHQTILFLTNPISFSLHLLASKRTQSTSQESQRSSKPILACSTTTRSITNNTKTLYASRTSSRQSNWHRRSSQPYRPSLALFNLEPLLPSSPTTHQDCPNIHFSLVHRQPPLIEYGH